MEIQNKTNIKSYISYLQFSDFELKTEDNKDIYITGKISTSALDRVNDIVSNECLNDMIEQLKNNNIKLDIEHSLFSNQERENQDLDKDMKPIPAGRIIDAKKIKDGIWVKAILNKAMPGFDRLVENLKTKMIDAFSIAFIPVQDVKKSINKTKVRILKKINLLNVALTGNPCNPECRIDSVITKALSDLKKMEDLKNIKMEEEKIGAKNQTPAPKENINELSSEQSKKENNIVQKRLSEEDKQEIKAIFKEMLEEKRCKKEVKTLTESVDDIRNRVLEMQGLKSVKEDIVKNNELKELQELKSKINQINEYLNHAEYKARQEETLYEKELARELEKKAIKKEQPKKGWATIIG